MIITPNIIGMWLCRFKIDNEFAQALSESYLEFALYEMNEMHDEMDASYFAKKGINARKNIDISPELINNQCFPNGLIQ